MTAEDMTRLTDAELAIELEKIGTAVCLEAASRLMRRPTNKQWVDTVRDQHQTIDAVSFDDETDQYPKR